MAALHLRELHSLFGWQFTCVMGIVLARRETCVFIDIRQWVVEGFLGLVDGVVSGVSAIVFPRRRGSWVRHDSTGVVLSLKFKDQFCALYPDIHACLSITGHLEASLVVNLRTAQLAFEGSRRAIPVLGDWLCNAIKQWRFSIRPDRKQRRNCGIPSFASKLAGNCVFAPLPRSAASRERKKSHERSPRNFL